MVEKKTIFFHVGTTKTGSTSIQNFLVENREVFRAEGFALYTGREGDPVTQLRVGGGAAMAFGSSESEMWVRAFVDRLKNCAEKKIIITDELVWFSLVNPDKWEKTASFISQLQGVADVSLIVYLRRQDEYLMSSYQQCLKYGWYSGKTCRQVMKRQNHDYMQYHAVLSKVLTLVDPAHLIVRPFECTQFVGGDLVQDFMSCVGLALTDAYVLATRRSNVGMDPFFSELLRCLSFFRHEMHEYEKLVECALSGLVRLEKPSGGHSFLSPRERRDYLVQFEEGNRWVAQQVLGRGDGVLFYEPLVSLDASWSEYRLDRQEVRAFFARAEFLSGSVRRKMCRQVLWVYRGRKPLWLRIRDRGREILKKRLHRIGGA